MFLLVSVSLRLNESESVLEKFEQRGVHLVGVGPGNAMRAAFDYHQLGAFDEFGCPWHG